ncbi:MAG: energy transducer TonB [Pyrinomonadaceae bacterium]
MTTKARVLRKPEPQYTEAARRNGVTGTVVLRSVFSSDGTVKHFVVVSGLPDGLTEQALRAARRIKFVPATIDGRPVSMFIQLEYNFNLY